jgi:hypothetical protein
MCIRHATAVLYLEQVDAIPCPPIPGILQITMPTSKEPAQEVEMASPLDIEAVATHQSEIHHLNEKVFDGDDALKVLHTHYEPYSPEEEKSLLRKIDFRMCSLMLVISKYYNCLPSNCISLQTNPW